MTDYKKYALGQLENFLHDCMNAETTTAQEIYDVIKSVVEDNYYTYKNSASQAYELLGLLNGNGKGHLTCDKDDLSPECKKSWSDFWQYTDEEIEEMCDAAELKQDLQDSRDFLTQDRNSNFPGENTIKDKVVKWLLPVEYIDDECFISLPEDLLEAANLEEGNNIKWIDNGDGSYLLKKVDKVEDEPVDENDWNKDYDV